MKRLGKCLLVLIIASSGFVSSCAVSDFDLEREVYERQIKQVRLGMSFDEFQNLFPQRISRGANKGDFGTLAAYEVAYAYYSFAATGVQRRNTFTGTERVVTWFFFLDDRLIKTGSVDAWPTEVEIRAAR
ncbi:hypothetical protein OMB55_00000020 [gamma proteobacterium HIMB55]|nr:hypothetical protein OMB55_00000020 [gamma proteobacterium HIMB55]